MMLFNVDHMVCVSVCVLCVCVYVCVCVIYFKQFCEFGRVLETSGAGYPIIFIYVAKNCC